MQMSTEVSELRAGSSPAMSNGTEAFIAPPQRASAMSESALIGVLGLLIGLGSAIYFHAVLGLRIETDVQAHLRIVALSLDYHAWPPNFLYYWVVALCAGFSRDASRLENSAIFVLGCSCALRFLISVWVGQQLLREHPQWATRRDLRFAFYVTVALLQVVHNVIDPHQKGAYLGYFSPNVWHNSTMIFLMPWAILMFYFAYRVVTRTAASDLWMLALMGVVNVAIKNSLVQVLALVVPVAAVLHHRLSVRSIKITLAVVPAIAFIGAQAAFIYSQRFSGSVLAHYHEQIGTAGDSKVAFEFLALWPKHTLSTILCSFLYPITAIAVLRMRLVRDALFGFAAACFAVAMAEYMCLVETGYRRLHGNFSWQVLICTYMLFLSVIVVQFRQFLRQQRDDERDLIPGVAFAIHVLCGLAYFGIIFATGNFRGD